MWMTTSDSFINLDTVNKIGVVQVFNAPRVEQWQVIATLNNGQDEIEGFQTSKAAWVYAGKVMKKIHINETKG